MEQEFASTKRKQLAATAISSAVGRERFLAELEEQYETLASGLLKWLKTTKEKHANMNPDDSADLQACLLYPTKPCFVARQHTP